MTSYQRFTGPQILRFQHKYPDAYKRTSRISLVSSFLASVCLGKIAPFDISDVCGMNLWDIKAGGWNEKLVALAAGSFGAEDLKKKLGSVSEDGGVHLGKVSSYFVHKYGFNAACIVVAFTGDNPSTIIALPLRSLDAMVSLGTSTTFLMSTPEYKPDPATHFFNHPTTPRQYMFMLCYKNGGLAREKVRDAVNAKVRLREGTRFVGRLRQALAEHTAAGATRRLEIHENGSLLSKARNHSQSTERRVAFQLQSRDRKSRRVRSGPPEARG